MCLIPDICFVSVTACFTIMFFSFLSLLFYQVVEKIVWFDVCTDVSTDLFGVMDNTNPANDDDNFDAGGVDELVASRKRIIAVNNFAMSDK